ncbi:MAG: hypothetical protein COA84_14510 [Robiginitomaculum sp.]|nr:MAG: hypothetical protein COA84_14510 [Robiginitomaculum sp.]
MTAPITTLAPVLSTALRSAAGRAGVSFDFMVRTAVRESGLNSDAKAKTSSAAGLFQFVEQTWLNMVSRHGASNGLAKEAVAITSQDNGRLGVADPAEYQRILDLRFDPNISAQMAGELTRENAQVLGRHLGRAPDEAELYIAHFMGAGQASALINAADITPGARAATLFPKEAKANQPIFFDKSGEARSIGDVLAALKSAHQLPQTTASDSTRTAQASAPISSALLPRTQFLSAFGGPILHLTPAIIQILSELSAPERSAPDERSNGQKGVNMRKDSA